MTAQLNNPLTVPPQRKGGRQRTDLTPQQLDALVMLDVVETAALLRVGTDKVRQAIKRGELLAEDFGSAQRPKYRIPREAIDAYRESKRVIPEGK